MIPEEEEEIPVAELVEQAVAAPPIAAVSKPTPPPMKREIKEPAHARAEDVDNRPRVSRRQDDDEEDDRPSARKRQDDDDVRPRARRARDDDDEEDE